MTKRLSNIALPPDAGRVLSAAQQRAAQLQAELTLLGRLVRGYCTSIGLDPEQTYEIVEDNGKLYAKRKT